MSLLYTCTWCQCEYALPLLPSSPEIPHTRSAGTPSHGDQRDPGIPWLPWSPPGSSHLPVRDASLCSLLLLSRFLAETCTGCQSRAGLWGTQAGAGPLLGGEWRLASRGCSVPSQKRRELESPSTPPTLQARAHCEEGAPPMTVTTTHASQLHPSPSALHPASI